MTHSTHGARLRLAAALTATLLAGGGAVTGMASAKGTTKHKTARKHKHASKPIGAFTTRGAWSFGSAPRLHPPKLHTTSRPASGKLASGDFLLASFPNLGATEPAKGKGLVMVGQSGPLILDSRLQPLWFQPVPTSVVAADLQQETYLGAPVLVWWQGVETNTGATKSGEVVVVNQHYKRIATVKAAAPWVISLHDAVISGPGIWVTAYRLLSHQNLTRYGGSRSGSFYDTAVQEYSVATGKLLYSWDAMAHIPLSDSEQHAPKSAAPWDVYHLNSIQVISPTEVLISMRNTWGVYLLNTATGQLVWTLGGKHSSFKGPASARFAWQHDARLLSNGELTLFNDNCCELLSGGKFAAANGHAEGMVLRLDQAKHTVSLVAAYPHKPAVTSYYLGSMQLLPGGRALVGWGSPLSYVSEYAKSGAQLLDAAWPNAPGVRYSTDLSYRALYTSSWVGTPSSPPAGAVRTRGGKTTVYASWNGATQVTLWEVLAGSSAKKLKVVAKPRKSGFETAAVLKHAYKAYEVRALDAKGHILGTSAVFK